MEDRKLKLRDVRMSKKTILKRVAVILTMMLVAGILTLVIQQGEYQRKTVDGHTVIVDDSFSFLQGGKRPVWTWFISPLKALVSSGSTTSIMIIISMLLMGGVMVLLDESKIMLYLVSAIIEKFGKNKYRLLAVLAGVMMLMGSTISFYDQCSIFIPMTVGVSYALEWDSLVGIGLSYLAIAMGFAVSTLNPYTVGIPQSIAGLPVNSGLWLRVILLIVMYVLYVTWLTAYAKKVEADPDSSVLIEEDEKIRLMFPDHADTEVLGDRRIRRGVFWFAGALLFVFLYTIAGLFVKGLSSLAMPVMILSLTVGAVGGALSAGTVKGRDILSCFGSGIKITAPSALTVLLIIGARQIIIDGKIMDTLLYYAYNGLQGTSPYIGIFIILLITMAMEFVVGSATAKAFLLLPLLTPLGNMIGLTSQSVVQAYIFGDGFTNAFYPTSNMLLLISGLMGFSITKWYRWSWKLILRIVLLEIVTLVVCVAIGYGPF